LRVHPTVAEPAPVVLVLGAASRDVTVDDPRGWRLGGAAVYASLALARLGLAVRAVIGVDREAARAPELESLREAGVATTFADLLSGPVFDNVAHVLHAPSDRIPLTALPRPWAWGFGALLLAPVAAEIGDEWATLATEHSRPLVALGWQGLLRRLAAGEVIRPRPPEASPLTRAAGLAVVSREDVPPGTRPESMLGLLAPEASLVWTEGETGGLLVRGGPDAGSSIALRYPAMPSATVVDPTGAGDVFLAALLACRLKPSLIGRGGGPRLPNELRFAAAAASLAVEAPGVGGVPDLNAVRRRLTRLPSRASRRPSADSRPGSGRPSDA
jgi:sugar/nucleoside kinase (ribokinase family)